MGKKKIKRLKVLSIVILVVVAFSVAIVAMVLFGREAIEPLVFWPVFIGVPLLLLPLSIGILKVVTDSLYEKHYENLPIFIVQAQVFGKTTHTSRGYMGENAMVPDTTSHFVSFEFDNRRVSIQTDVALYNTLGESDTGVLTYKEDGEEFVFVSFECHS